MVDPDSSPTHLLVVHFHLRPGGVRRVIEIALPAIVAAGPSVRSVTLLTGEASDPGWTASLAAALPDISFRLMMNPAIGYFSEIVTDHDRLGAEISGALESAVAGHATTVVWAHNLSLARNVTLAAALAQFAGRPGISLVAHGHDFWFDQRWERAREFGAAGWNDLGAVGGAIFCGGAKVAFATVNQADCDALASAGIPRVAWLPNPVNPLPDPSGKRVASARAWMRGRIGCDAPAWILPTRFLRRKNIAEAMLVTRWVDPDAWLVTTSGPSSIDEDECFRALSDLAQRRNWPCKLAVLNVGDGAAPPVDDLVAASDGVVSSSLIEGFGLPILEAMMAGKPLIARRISRVALDLEQLGIRLPCVYDEVWVHPDSIDVGAEVERQHRRWLSWTERLPPALRTLAPEPWLFSWNSGEALAFGRLTLEAQIEVLSNEFAVLRNSSAKWNPKLESWRSIATVGRLPVGRLGSSTVERLSPERYAEGFWRLANQCEWLTGEAARDAHAAMMTGCIRSTTAFPLLWKSECDG